MATFQYPIYAKSALFRLTGWLIAKRLYYEIRPQSTRKIFTPNPSKKPAYLKPKHPKTHSPRINELGIQMLSKPIYDQIFPNSHKGPTITKELIELSKSELLKHNMKREDIEMQHEVDFKLPPLKGANIEDHFLIIGNEQIQCYKDLLSKLLKHIPDPPQNWLMQQGWIRYEPGQLPQKVDYPLEDALVFDVETCVRVGKAPTLATAVSNKAWYGWISTTLIDGTYIPNTTHQYHLDTLVPLESAPGDNGENLNEHQLKPKVIVGHNVSFDRARIKEQYWLNKTNTRFVDTMSLHVCISGLTSYQRAIMKSSKFIEEDDIWKGNSSLNNLVDVYSLYCRGKLSKETRNLFLEGSLSDIKENFQEVMNYCCGDVIATYDVLKAQYPLFLERFPHPVTFAGMLELGTAYLPLNENWNRYIADSEQSFEDLENEGRIILARRADEACQLMHHEEYKKDLWFWDEDWGVKQLKLKKVVTKNKKFEELEQKGEDEEVDELEKKFRDLWRTGEHLPKNRTLLPGYPNWYRKLCTKPGSTLDWVPGPHLISTSMKISPKLLSLTWEGYPLHHIKNKGWGFLVPFSHDLDISTQLPLQQLLEKCPLLTQKPDSVDGKEAMANIAKSVDEHLCKKEYYSQLKKDKTGGLYRGTGIWCNEEVDGCCWFFKLPHKDGAAYNVGNPLAKDFLNKFSENVLAGDSESAEEVLTLARKVSYWRNNRSRILEQMVVWLPEEHLPKRVRKSGMVYGAIVPQVVVCGTLTRRAMEPTWMTASNAHLERIGSELKAMIQAPSGYNIVGADVDSQELWIASVLGDAHSAKMHGGTPLGWMTLSGTKAKKTDMHSVTAQAVGISRDHAKVINYARIYGAGQQFAERLLRQFNPSMSESEAKSKAQKMFALTKGRKLYILRPEYLIEFEDKPYSKWQAFQMAKAWGKSVDQVFCNSKWVGGTESAMFNRLEEIANGPEPRTPFLGGRLTRALETESLNEDRFMTTRVNWVVQSGAVDFLHLLLTCMRWIMGDKVRFCISFHDEVRYIVPEKYKYCAALALHVANLLTRSFCCHRLGIYDLPQSVAFFSSVEIDTVLRKECNDDCQTPSNPHGLEKGYGIKHGENLDIYLAIEKAQGKNSCWFKGDGLKEAHKRNDRK
ncbi:DNA polymerase subunit gamma-1, mitochondrial [Euwallacea similis]|uniref:DNA polymerase subunit gamma-1, mitochondrial n=1 Tax=Euwallacea similis TaxID=1736056 RepID=UPI00344BBECE